MRFINCSVKWVIIFSCSVLFAGCVQTMKIDHYPQCYNPNITTVAIGTFKNQTPQVNAGEVMADHLASSLSVNRTYTIIGPRKIEEALQKRNEKISDMNYAAQAKIVGEITHADAYITGAVLADSVFKSTYVTADYTDTYDDFERFHPHWMSPYYQDVDYVTEAFISVNASMVSVHDGRLICTTAGPVKASSSVRGIGTEEGFNASEYTIYKAAKQIEYQFAIVPADIKVYPDKDIRIASGRKGTVWNFTGSFGKNDETMYAVIHLPAEAAKNKFSLTITSQKQKDNMLFSQDFTWKSGENEQGFLFSPRQIAAKNGTGKYSVNLCYKGKIIMSHDFSIKD
jgi:hypothetical protein